MATITTRSGKGSPLTNNEVDANFTNLNTDKAELSGATFTGAITANAGLTAKSVGNAYTNGSIALLPSGSGATNYITNAVGNFFISQDGTRDDIRLNSSGITFNESGADMDFRVESDNNTHALFVNGGNNHVGVGTATLNRSGLGSDHICLTVGADSQMGMLELQGTRTSNADLGRVSFLNAGTRRAEIVAARIDADNSTKLYFQTSNAGSLGTRLTIGKDGAATFNSSVKAPLSYVGSGSFPVTPNANGDDLVIFGSGSHGMSILTGTSGDGNIFFGDSGGDVRGKLAYSHNGDYMTTTSAGAYNTVAGGSIKLDAGGGITLDADGGQVDFKDGGVLKALIDFSGNNVEIQSRVTDGDILFRGQDGGSFITALTLDMSAAGAATHNSTIATGSGGASGKIAIAGNTATSEAAHITFTNGAGAKVFAVGGGQSGVTNNGFVIRNVTDNTFPLVISDAGAATFTGAITANAGVVVDNITIDGNEIDCSSGNLVLDGASEIHLDADSGIIRFRDDGGDIGMFRNESQDFTIRSMVSNKDMLFKGNDNGSTITMLSLDASQAGQATFNNGITDTFLTGSITPLIVRATNPTSTDKWGMYAQYRSASANGNGAGMTLGLYNASGAEAEYAYFGAIIEDNTAGSQDGAFIVAPVLNNARVERFRISSSGAATFTPASGETVVIARDSAGPYFGTSSNKSLRLITNNATRLTVSNSGNISTTPPAGNHFVINENGVDSDFRVESNNSTHALFVDGGTNRVGVGTGAPSYLLDAQNAGDAVIQARTTTNSSGNDAIFRASLAGSSAGDAYVQFDIDSVGGYALGIDNSDSDKFKLTYGGPATPSSGTTLLDITTAGAASFASDILISGTSVIGKSDDTDTYLQFDGADKFRIVTGGAERFAVTNAGVIVNEDSHDQDFRVESNDNANMLFVDGGTNKIAIGHATPDTELHVIGNGNDAQMPFIVGNEDHVDNSTSQSVAIGFGLSRDSGTVKNNAGLIKVGKTAAWTSDDANIDSFMSFSTYNNNAVGERLRIDNVGKIKIGNNIPIWSGSYGGALFLKGNNATSDRYAQLCIVDSNGAIAQAGLTVNNNGSITCGGAGDVIITDGNLKVASGHGIDFSATAGSGTSELLDDYEEGQYDCSVTCGTSGTITLNGSFNRAAYTKVGRLVTVHGFLVVSSVSSPTGFFNVTLPFTPASLTDRAGDSVVSLVIQNVASANISDFVGTINENDARIYIQLGDSNTVQNDSAQQVAANTYVHFSATYSTA